MKSTNSHSWNKALTTAAVIASNVVWLGLSANTAMALSAASGEGATEPKAQKHTAAQRVWETTERTQGGARTPFTTLKDWGVKAENLSPRGHNPLYFPLKPGFRYILEHPNHPWGHFRKEVIVLDKTEKFDVPGIGKFECAVVQEEEFLDGVYDQQAINWFCIDKVTNNMYTFGEKTWEHDQVGRKVFVGTWRVGEPDGKGVAEPGLLMPGTFKVGDKYAHEAHEAEAYSYTENIAEGLTMTTPVGTFKDCVQTREFSLINPSDVIDKWWCKGIGEVKDSADGKLVASDAVPGTDTTSIGKYHRNPVQKVVPPVAKIDGTEATKIALKETPGEATSIKVERLGKRNVYAVELVAKEDGQEWNVFVDMETGKIVRKDN